MNYWNPTKRKVNGTEEILEEKCWELSKYDLRDQTINLGSVANHKNQDKYKMYTRSKKNYFQPTIKPNNKGNIFDACRGVKNYN